MKVNALTVKFLLCAAAVLILISVATTPASAAPAGAGFTTYVNQADCLDSPNAIDCNNYTSKDGVYMNGGPVSGDVSTPGCYFFAVVVPGFQNGGFLDGAAGNLSDSTPSADSKSNPAYLGAGSGDSVANRTFQINPDHSITYPSTACGTAAPYHQTGTQFNTTSKEVVQLSPYDDTTNLGGVYILAICEQGATSSSQCKFDAFRIKTNNVCTENCGGLPSTATVTICKFWDQNQDHIWDNDEPFVGAWGMHATSGDTNVSLDAAYKLTDNTVVSGTPGESFGCATFTLTWPADYTVPVTVSFTEDSGPSAGSYSCNLGAQLCALTPTGVSWTQSAPWDSVAKAPISTITAVVNPGDDATADNFGNYFKTGALTMGFWKNTNGQKIIKNYCGGTSGTSLYTFLRSYNPFLDLSANTCTGEAAYVATVIGAATCGGSTCNPMLKAQMLATALDVYFSDPSLGGNRIGAYNGLGGATPPLGGVAIDLTQVCNMIDSSGGATCSGNFEDTRYEFGIDTTCRGATVSTMLAYSNFLSNVNGSPNGSAVSNSGGSKWYNQNKTKQVYAKDSFDNINNGIAATTVTGVCTSTF